MTKGILSISTIIVLFQYFLIQLQTVQSDKYTIYDAPKLDNSDQVQIYYLQAPFPSNVPSDIKETAGSLYRNYGQLHGGIGVWDKTTDDKLTIEFYSEDFVGGLLPDLTDDGKLIWKNKGKIEITLEANADDWINARLITITSGNAYTQLIDYLKDTEYEYQYYQPVNIVYVNSSKVQSADDDEILSHSDIKSFGRTLVSGHSSYWFVYRLIDKLDSYGCDLDSFLNLYTSSFNYLAANDESPSEISWNENDQANEDVYQWYKDLTTCYKEVYQNTSETNSGATGFFEDIKDCYGSYAYVYKSNYSVYKVSLANYDSKNSSEKSPIVSTHVYYLPDDDSDDSESLGVIDYLMVALAGLAVIAGCAFFLFKLFGKKQRRRVSFEGEKVAMNVAANLTEDDQEERAYYHGPTRRKESLLARFSARFSQDTSQPGNSSREEESEDSLEKPLTAYGYIHTSTRESNDFHPL